MNALLDRFAERYAAALEGFLVKGSESALNEAYELGREALNNGLGVLDMVSLHYRATAALIILRSAKAADTQMLKAAAFLTESLSPFEMTLRGYQETNARLIMLNETLERAYAATRTTNERLIAEMAERQRAEEALRQGQKLQVVGQLAGGVAHDFNNLLTVLLNDLDKAIRRADGDDTMVEMLAHALSAAERAAKVTSHLLAFSRKQILLSHVVEPAERLRNAALLVERSLGDSITIETNFSDDLWKIKIDTNKLDLALLNLAFNSRDAMPNGGTIRISAANRTLKDERLGIEGDYVLIEIADNGSGIPPEVLPNVFEPFFTTKEVGAGSGLGLSQVHGFAHQSGGAIDIASEVGKGTVVTLYLRAVHSAPATLPSGTTRTDGPNVTILVVEDERIVAEVAARLLRQSGFIVKVAYHAQMALDLLEKSDAIDAIFSDIKMPGAMTGIRLAEVVRARFPYMPVLLTTGHDEAANDAIANGFEIISKPYRSEELVTRLKTFLGRKEVDSASVLVDSWRSPETRAGTTPPPFPQLYTSATLSSRSSEKRIVI
jgi:signal transduction histidine kinase/DNA-binding NarL/FixJ family response regulator